MVGDYKLSKGGISFTFKCIDQMHFKGCFGMPRTRLIVDNFYVRMGLSLKVYDHA